MLRQPRFIPFIVCLLVALTACQSMPAPTEQPAVPPPPTLALASLALPPPPATPTRSPTTTPTVTPLAAEVSPSPTLGPTTTPIVIRTPSHDLAALTEYQKGIAFTTLDNASYLSAQSDAALDLLFATGANYISLLVTWYQTDWHSTEIHRADNTPSDEALLHVINYAHAHGVHVLLKPQVDFATDTDHWRGEITFDGDAGWQQWFASYREFILYYAQFAQKNGVEEFSVGTELASASTHTAEWRGIIRAVRSAYTGLVTYSANHSGEEVKVEFWDDLDFIGVNNFYHLTNYRNPTLDQLMAGWQLPALQLTRLHERFPNQPIIFTEVGYPSLERANVWPWNWSRGGPISLDEQANCYESLFLTWWKNPDRPWFRGLFIWNWLADPDQGGPNNGDYTPHNKPAEQVLKSWFSEAGPASDPAQPSTPLAPVQ